MWHNSLPFFELVLLSQVDTISSLFISAESLLITSVTDMFIFMRFYLSQCLILEFCSSTCPIVESDKHGRLTVGQTEENDPDTCVGKFTFTNEETKQMFCLNKEAGTDILTCLANKCTCGKENKPIIFLK